MGLCMHHSVLVYVFLFEQGSAAAMSLFLSEDQLTRLALGFLFSGDFWTESLRPVQITQVFAGL